MTIRTAQVLKLLDLNPSVGKGVRRTPILRDTINAVKTLGSERFTIQRTGTIVELVNRDKKSLISKMWHDKLSFIGKNPRAAISKLLNYLKGGCHVADYFDLFTAKTPAFKFGKYTPPNVGK